MAVRYRSLPWMDRHGYRLSVYRITSKYSNASRTSQTCSFAKWHHILHPNVAFEAPWSCACCGIKSFHDIILHLYLNQCWKTLLFEYLAAIRYHLKKYFLDQSIQKWNKFNSEKKSTGSERCELDILFPRECWLLPSVSGWYKSNSDDVCPGDIREYLSSLHNLFYATFSVNSLNKYWAKNTAILSTVKELPLTAHLRHRHSLGPVILNRPKYRLGHPENYLILLSNDFFSVSKYAQQILLQSKKQMNYLGLHDVGTDVEDRYWRPRWRIRRSTS